MIKEPPWKKNVESFLVLYSILALVASAFLIFAFDDKQGLIKYWYFVHLPLALSLFCFVYSAEQALDAVDENDVDKYCSVFITYNIAFILLVLGVISIFYFKFVYVPTCSCLQILKGVGFFIIYLVFIWHWACDLIWLIRSSEKEFGKYKEELLGHLDPEKDPGIIYRLFGWLRRKLSEKN